MAAERGELRQVPGPEHDPSLLTASLQQTRLPYLKQELAGVFCTVEQLCCSHLISTSFVFPFSVEIHRVPQDGKQRVNSNSSCNQHEISRGIFRLRVKEEVSTHSHGHFRVQCALRQDRKDPPLVLCSSGPNPDVPL